MAFSRLVTPLMWSEYALGEPGKSEKLASGLKSWGTWTRVRLLLVPVECSSRFSVLEWLSILKIISRVVLVGVRDSDMLQNWENSLI